MECRRGQVDDNENYELLSSILNLGINTFVCLQLEYQTEGVTEAMWRSGQALRPYFADAVGVADQLRQNVASPASDSRLTFIHFPIEDCNVVEDDPVQGLAEYLVDLMRRGYRLYLHCWGGHGRTGTLVCIILHLIYGLDSSEALRRCQFVHDLRRVPVIVGSPQTLSQRNQVCRIIHRLEAQAHARVDVVRNGTLVPGNSTGQGTTSRSTCSAILLNRNRCR